MLTKGQCMSHDHPEVGWQSRARLRRESSDSGLGFCPPQPFTHHSERQMETAPTRNPRGKTPLTAGRPTGEGRPGAAPPAALGLGSPLPRGTQVTLLHGTGVESFFQEKRGDTRG